jgi:Bardet-Biedl syndrome 9 protein
LETMSLFQLRDWWRVQQGLGSEEFDQGSIVVANVDNAARNKVKIVTGSLSGMLRIFLPRSKECNPADQLLEQQLTQPILQLAVGRFAPGTPFALAVLHPQSLVIYQVTRPRADLDDDEVPFLELQQLQHHELPHTAANLCYGTFGGDQGHDAILVQSFDGQVYIFEHNQLVQTTYFEDFLVPGPLAYVPTTDSIVTCSSAFELQSYTYGSLVHALGTRADARAAADSALTRRKTPSPQWTVTVGELAVDIQLQPNGEKKQVGFDIIVVGEHTIVVCTQDGTLKAQRRLDYHPAAAVAYRC